MNLKSTVFYLDTIKLQKPTLQYLIYESGEGPGSNSAPENILNRAGPKTSAPFQACLPTGRLRQNSIHLDNLSTPREAQYQQLCKFELPSDEQ